MGPDCIDGLCIGPQCFSSTEFFGGVCTGVGCPPGSGGPDDESCTSKKTATTCTTTTTSTTVSPATTWTTWSHSRCRTNVGCRVTDSSTSKTETAGVSFPTIYAPFTDYLGQAPLGVPANTHKLDPVNGVPASVTGSPTSGSPVTDGPDSVTTIVGPPNTKFVDCTHRNQNPGSGVTKAYCVCSGSTFAEEVATFVTPANSCAYTLMPSRTIDPIGDMLVTTNTAECSVCTVVGHNNNLCTSLSNCTPAPTTSTATATPTPSGRVCAGLWGSAFAGDLNPDWSYGLFKESSPCDAKTSTQYLSAEQIGLCGLAGKNTDISVCGKIVRLVIGGDVSEVEKGSKCGIQLQIDGKNYSGKVTSGSTCGASCFVGVAFGSSSGRILFENVPLCE